jgi:hypothetical protein
MLNLVIRTVTTSDTAFNDANAASKSEVTATAIYDYQPTGLEFYFKIDVRTARAADTKLCSPITPVPRTAAGQRGKSLSCISHSTKVRANCRQQPNVTPFYIHPNSFFP